MFKRVVEFLKDALAYGTSSVMQKLIGFLLIPLYTRYLQPEDYGVIAMLMVMQTISESFVLLGQKSAVFREVGLAKDNQHRGKALSMGLAVVATSGAATFLVSQYFAPQLTQLFLDPGQDIKLVRVTLVSSFLNVLCEMPRMALQADRRAKTAAGLTAARTIATMILTVIFVVGLEWGVWGIVWSVLLTHIPFTFIYLFLCGKIFGFYWSRDMAKKLMIYGLPFVPYRVQMMLFAFFGDYAVRTKLGLHEAGLYNVATRFALPLGFVVTALTNAWWGYKFHLFKEEKEPAKAISSITTYTFVGLSYLWLGVSLWGPEVMKLLTPEKYHAGAILIPALALYRLLTGIYQMLTSGIELGNNARPIFLVGTSGLMVVVPLGLWSIEHYGAMGAALAMCAAQLVTNYAGYRLAQSRFQITYDWWTNGLVFISAIGLVGFGLSFDFLSLGPRLGLLLGISLAYPVLAFAFLARSRFERNQIKEAVQRFKETRSKKTKRDPIQPKS